MNTNFKVIGLTLVGIKPESTAPEADALATRLSELLISHGRMMVLAMKHSRQINTTVTTATTFVLCGICITNFAT